jgi:ABC-type sugar transport system permease subunit
MVLPALVGLLLFKVWPIFEAFRQSLLLASVVPGQEHWAGLANYASLVRDSTFWRSVRVTLWFNLLINPVQTVAALGLALLVWRPGPGVSLFRTLYFLPMTVSITITSIIWRLVLDPYAGLANSFFTAASLPTQPFLTSARQALGSIILLATWKGAGYWMIFILAGLTRIPDELLEAAALDGAGAWQVLWRVTLPLLRRVLAFVLVADTAINFLMFTPVYLLTLGGPAGSTNLLMFQTYRTAFQLLDFGRASAMAMMILVIILGVAAFELRLLRAEFSY